MISRECFPWISSAYCSQISNTQEIFIKNMRNIKDYGFINKPAYDLLQQIKSSYPKFEHWNSYTRVSYAIAIQEVSGRIYMRLISSEIDPIADKYMEKCDNDLSH